MNESDPQISWMTIVGAVAVVGLMCGGQWVVSQTQFAHGADVQRTMREDFLTLSAKVQHDMVSRDEFAQFQDRYAAALAHVNRLDDQLVKLNSTEARDPVEKATMDAIISATDKRIDLIQAQITDINRQIAAALIIIDNNSAGPKKITPSLPP